MWRLSDAQASVLTALLRGRGRRLSVYEASTGARVFRCDGLLDGPARHEADGRTVRGLYLRGLLEPEAPGRAELPPRRMLGYYRVSWRGARLLVRDLRLRL